MSSFGRQSIITVGRSIKLTADGRPEEKTGGVTLDWATIVAAVAASVLADGVQIAVGEKFVRYGQVLTKITGPAQDTIAMTATGGTFTVTVTTSAGAQTTGAQAYNVTPANLQTAIRGLSNVGGTLATVTGTAGSSYVITYDNSLGAVTTTVGTGSLTGGTATVTTQAPGGDVGKYGPYDTAATDGRATLTKGACYVVNETMKENDLHSDFPPVIDGGRIFRDRLIATAGTHSLANGPTYTELEAVLPRLTYADQG